MVLGGWECSGDGNAAVTFELHARCGVPCGRMEMCLAARKMHTFHAGRGWFLLVRDPESWQLCQFENAILIGGAVEWIVGEQQGAV